MENIVERLHEGIHILGRKNVQRGDMLISMHPSIERLLLEEFMEMHYYLPSIDNMGHIKFFEGISVNPDHPYEEIVIYSKYFFNNPDNLVVKITFS